jgi:hypothetical protein
MLIITEIDKKYQKYLNSVLEKTEEYKEIKFLIERWKTLKATSDKLRSDTEKSIRESEAQRFQIQKYVEEKANEILGYNNVVANLRKELEESIDHTLQEENIIDERTDGIVSKNSEFVQIRMSVTFRS